MTPLELLLGLLRVSFVTAVALLLGRILLRRCPAAAPGLALAGLLSGCALLATAGAEWPIVWQASLPSDRSVADVADAVEPRGIGEENSWSGLSLAEVLGMLSDSSAPDKSSSLPWRGLLVVAGGLIAFAVGHVLLGMTATLRLHQSSRRITHPRLSALTTELAPDHPSSSAIVFRVSGRVAAPCVSVIDRHSVYLPASWPELSDDELAASVAHELAHLQRSDAFWRLVAQLATALQVFHPFAHGLLRQLVLGQELSADRLAARLLGPQRYVRGISQLALRLDAESIVRQPIGVGISHSSSFLIRRIMMLRKGMLDGPDGGRYLVQRMAVLLVVASAALSATWSLLAEEPVRVASRTKVKADGGLSRTDEQPWSLLPGRTGYWRLDVEAVLKHPVAGQWLRQADALFLTPGWSQVARANARDRRAELGLSLVNFASLSGSATMDNGTTESDGEEPTFHTKVTSNQAVVRLREPVDWKAIGEALPEERLDEAIQGLVDATFTQEAAQELIDQDTIAGFFALQKDPLRLILRGDEDEEQPATPAVIPALWEDHKGELATLIVMLPHLSGPGKTKMEKLFYALHQSAEFYIVGIDNSNQPENFRLRLGLSPRGAVTPHELATLMEKALQTGIEEADSDDDASILKFFAKSEPKVHAADNSSQPSAVMVEADLSAAELWRIIAE